MELREFGNSGVKASTVGFGVWTVAAPWWPVKLDEKEKHAILRKALDRGINFFDTADTYGSGIGETILKDALGDVRDKIVISTKYGYQWEGIDPAERKGQQELPQDFSPKYTAYAVEGALKRLGTDRIDLFQLHNAKMTDIERDDTFAELAKQKQAGKVLSYGVAIGPAIGWEPEGIAAMQKQDIDCLMIIYNLLEQEPGRQFMPVADETKTGLLVRVPHSSGMLEGVYNKDTKFEKGDHRSHRKKAWLEQGLKKIEQLKPFTEGKGRTLAQLAIQYILAHPQVTSLLPNIYNEQQLEEFASAVDTPALDEEEIKKIDELYDTNFGLQRDMSDAKVAVKG